MNAFARAAAILAACCLILPVLTACGPKGGRVPLSYVIKGGPAQACAQSVGVVWFEDDRGTDTIGRNGQEGLLPRSMGVTTWVTNALVGEIAARGCKAEVMADGSPFAPDMVVQGEVRKVYLVRDDLDLTLDMALHMTLLKEGEKVMVKDYTGQWQRTTAPTEDVFVEMYREGLADLLQQVADDVAAKLR